MKKYLEKCYNPCYEVYFLHELSEQKKAVTNLYYCGRDNSLKERYEWIHLIIKEK